MSACLDDETVALMSDGKLSGARRRAADEHLERCASCRDLVAHVLPETRREPLDVRAAFDEEIPAPGTRLGRYVVERLLGRGGMGVVVLAHDPELDRPVAIKVLRPERRAEDEERLVREARAMARVVHPNVLVIHDVGAADGRIHLAMEYIEGTTLRDWLADAPRSESEILAAFAAAGRGLAAAHAVGIVHRDFKPDNVLVAKDGRIRVADFGLAHASRAHATPATGDEADGERAPASFGDGLTHTGLVMGTPAYMAPEQHAGERATPRTDQFAFAVALWAALTGARPFAGKDLAELAANVRAGKIVVTDAARAKLRRPIERALRRALAVDPAARFATMNDLLAALAPRRSRRIWAAVGTLAAGGLALGAVLLLRSKPPPPAPACAGIDAEMASTWNDRERAALRASLTAADVPPASGVSREEAAGRVVATFDSYAAAWVAEATDACQATNVRHAQTEELFAARTACLADRRGEMHALVTALEKGDATVLDRALVASARLTPVSACTDAVALRAHGPPPPAPAIAGDVERIRASLRDVRALDASGHSYQAEQAAKAAVEQARALDFRPLLAEALLALGEVSTADDAKQPLLDAVWNAEASHHDVVAAKAWVALLRNASAARDFGEIEEWSRRASASIERLEGESATKAALQSALAEVRFGVGRSEEARDLATNALRTRASAANAETLDDASDLEQRAMAEIELDDRGAAEADLQREVAIVERLLGKDYDELDQATMELGRLVAERGDWEGALAAFAKADALAVRRLKRLRERTDRVASDPSATLGQVTRAEAPVYGVHHLIAAIAVARGDALAAKGELDAAEAAFRAALAEADGTFGKKSRTSVPALVGLAELALRRGRDAKTLAQDAWAAAKAHAAPSDPDRIAAAIAVAAALQAGGDGRGAKAALEDVPKDAKLSSRLAARLALVKRAVDPKGGWDPAPFLARAGRLADPERARAQR